MVFAIRFFNAVNTSVGSQFAFSPDEVPLFVIGGTVGCGECMILGESRGAKHQKCRVNRGGTREIQETRLEYV
ncbi:MAG: hypothetical protein A3H43_02060 [Gammaproteobacteria bacterium RIFCSPLOWO2_02_FULL_42_9]|nr:MAG: hypothetical protein A3H43_02060 [Gammaproteobacteria bacterium RIFCSPLOWO2_02_FULL_42_9]